ncbi:MAG TPA: hypothetical protein VHA12_02215 [Candidatus Nanoarchaeia archaeon]|nr:hypothetical protein [Candidatus Nanoarchaeia archaeon]
MRESLIYLPAPANPEQTAELIARATLTPAERKEVERIINRADKKFKDEDYDSKISLLTDSLQGVKTKFGPHIAPERCLLFQIGYQHESKATFGFGPSRTEGGDPLERAGRFELAAVWYQAADELAGYTTDYALRQAQSCFGAGRFNNNAGKGELASWFTDRGQNLIAILFGRDPRSIQFVGAIPESYRHLAQAKLPGVADAYLFKRTGQN